MSIPFPVHIPFAESLGLVLHSSGSGQSELRVSVRPELCNSWHAAHGGLLMTLLDVAMAQAARGLVRHDPGQAPGMATIEMKASFMQPAHGELRSLGKVLHRTASMVFCEASVLDAAGELCAHATGTFKVLRARNAASPASPAGPAQPAHPDDPRA